MSSGDTGLGWSEELRKGRRLEGSPIIRNLAAILFLVLLVSARKLLGGGGDAHVGSSTDTGTKTGSTWSEDLERDRRFERSLVFRMIAVLILVAILTVARELLS